MAYKRTNWQNGVTPLSAQNMNNIEDGIQENQAAINLTNNNVANIKKEVQTISDEAVKIVNIEEDDV